MRKKTLEIDADGWKGQVVCKLPKINQRFHLMGQMNVKISSEGEVDTEKLDMINLVSKLVPIVPEFVESVNLTFQEKVVGDVAEGTPEPEIHKITVYEDLEYCNEGIGVIAQIGMFLLQGESLSKN